MEKCFKCGREVTPIEAVYTVAPPMVLCEEHGSQWIEMRSRHLKEEQEFLREVKNAS